LIELADFFLPAQDTVNGGFYTYVDRTGAPTNPPLWGVTADCGETIDHQVKSIAAHSRVAHLYSRAFMVSGRQEYLQLARHALDFMYEHGWDEQHEGWWFTTNELGEVAPYLPCDWFDPNDWKWTYAQMYPLVGINAFVEATRSDFDMNWLRLGLQVLDAKLWDGRQGVDGYFSDADIDWANPRGKGFTPVVDGITTHAVMSYLLTREPALEQRLLALADEVVEHLVPSLDDPSVAFGFPEVYDADWHIDASNTQGEIGHVLKAAWVLLRAYLISPNPAYRAGAQRLIDEVLHNGGYDSVNGGPFTTYDWQTGAITQKKRYWDLEQAVMAGVLNVMIADHAEDKVASWRMAAESLQFFHEHLWDVEYGGHYYETDAYGNVTDPTKSEVFEQGYHVSELLYFSYLYGNLYLKRAPIQLYYHFDASDQDRSIELNPVEVTSERLRVIAVRLDGRRYRSFDSKTRTLKIPAGQSGTFKVTFELDSRSWR
jgi:mannose/cellobiose epimerase-like protein (N-acyl-D-glucosamine 2-epimerase family)